jgi:hypothetical protein
VDFTQQVFYKLCWAHSRRFSHQEPPAQTGLPSQACQTSLSSMLTECTLGVPIAEHKTEGPSLIIEFLGIIIDSQKMEARLPSDKLNRLFVDLNSWHTKKVSYTPRAPITNWNIKFCMQSNCPRSSFSATYHKSNTGGLQTTSSHSLDEWFSRRCKNVANFS